MKRLRFLSADLEHTHQIVNDLKNNDIPEKHTYVFAKHRAEFKDLSDAEPEADELLPAYERAVAIGSYAGLPTELFTLATLLVRRVSHKLGMDGQRAVDRLW